MWTGIWTGITSSGVVGGVSVVAAACLVIGVFVGHTMGTASAVSSDVVEGGDVAEGGKEPVVDASFSHVAEDHARREETNVTVVKADWHNDVVQGDQMRGPRVAMLCAISGKKYAAANEQQCLRCHDGITAAETDFRREHMNSPGFETCMWCHDTSAQREVRH
ncbi:MAG: hypothetical protein P8J37_19370 [Fuerstiella sp.]|nr:hypothetical protein [Fuerstiella sp.]